MERDPAASSSGSFADVDARDLGWSCAHALDVLRQMGSRAPTVTSTVDRMAAEHGPALRALAAQPPYARGEGSPERTMEYTRCAAAVLVALSEAADVVRAAVAAAEAAAGSAGGFSGVSSSRMHRRAGGTHHDEGPVSTVRGIFTGVGGSARAALTRLDTVLGMRVRRLAALYRPAGGAVEREELFRLRSVAKFWKKAFGRARLVDWERFYPEFRGRLLGGVPEEDGAPAPDEALLYRSLMDTAQDGAISPYELDNFVVLFGPLESLHSHFLWLARSGCLGGSLNSSDAASRLQLEPRGSYLLRLSRSEPETSIALTFRSSDSVKHILVTYDDPWGFTMKEGNKVHPSLAEFVRSYSDFLKRPSGYSDVQLEDYVDGCVTRATSSRNQINQLLNASAAATSRPVATSSFAEAAEKGEIESGSSCVVCMDSRRNTVFLECGHLVCCEGCAAPLNVCPICRADIVRKVHAFMS